MEAWPLKCFEKKKFYFTDINFSCKYDEANIFFKARPTFISNFDKMC